MAACESVPNSDTMEQFGLDGGGFLAYEYTGASASGVPIVFLNGILMNLRMWNAQVEAFSGSHPCLLHDFRGQLNSSKHLPTPMRLHTHVEDTLALLDYLHIGRCHIIGTSYGGEVGLLLAKTAPERIASLSVIASVSYSDELLQRQVKLWKDLAGLDAGLLYDAVLSASYSGGFLDRHGAFLQTRRDSFQALPEGFLRAFESLCDAFLAFELPAAELASIDIPTLVVSAALDILKPPRYSEHIAACMPNARHRSVEGAGHAVVVEQPTALRRILRAFIEK